jgi:uncharacterized protein (TIGR04222 family)
LLGAQCWQASGVHQAKENRYSIKKLVVIYNHIGGCMNQEYLQLYQRIQDFDLDDRNAKFPFSQKLAKENRWSAEYTQRAIEEYKKFAFLAVVAGHPVTPSEQVDRVWHLHLLYTRSYWEDFCPNVLQIHLHHNPTLGGSSEQSKYYNQYDRTLASYESFFGESPPTDIWSPAKIRFGRDTRVALVNTEQNWIISKPNWNLIPKFSVNRSVILSLLFVLTFMVTGCQVIASFPNPLKLTGPEFLAFYIPLAIVGLVLANSLRTFFCSSGDRPNQQQFEDLSTYEVAVLSGGDRPTSTAIASLIQQEYVEVEKKRFFLSTQKKLVLKKTVSDTFHPIEWSVARAIVVAKGEIKRVFQESRNSGNEIQERLQQLGLLLSADRAFKAQIYPSLIVAFLLGLGAIRIILGISAGKPTGYLIMCIIFLLVFGSKFFNKPYRSVEGDRILKDLTDRLQHLKTADRSNPELPLAFALFGAIVLTADSAFADFHQMLVSSGSGTAGIGVDGGAGCGGGCGGGGGGGCGGGCGG